MEKLVKSLTLFFLISAMFISFGFASFSNSLGINDIKALVRVNKPVRITNFYAASSKEDGVSSSESFNVNTVSTRVKLPYEDSTVTYVLEITNLKEIPVVISGYSIDELPEGYYVRFDDYTIGSQLCEPDRLNNPCTLGAKATIHMTIYRDESASTSSTNIETYMTFRFGSPYTIIYNINDGENDNKLLQEIDYTTRTNLTLNSFEREGYIFDHWNTVDDDSGADFYDGQEVLSIANVGEKLNLYAIWVEEVIETKIYGSCSGAKPGATVDTSTCNTTTVDTTKAYSYMTADETGLISSVTACTANTGVCFTTDGTDTYYQENLERLYTYLGGSLENPPSRCSTNTGSNGEEEVSCSITAGFIGVTESGNISIIDFMNGECVIDPELGYYSC